MAGSKFKVRKRRNEILRKLREEGKVSVAQLSRNLDITPVTVRSDLTALEREGYLLRVQGGAVLIDRADENATVREKISITCLEEKKAIAKRVADHIRDGDTLFINSGTTTKCIAEALRDRKSLNVVTNSLAVATELGGVPSIRVALLGGEINTQYGFTYGSDTQEQLSRYQADWVILSVDGINQKNGITTHHAEEAVIDRMMISGARKVLVAVDHRKIGHVGFARVCERSGNINLITDSAADEGMLAELENDGWGIIRA